MQTAASKNENPQISQETLLDSMNQIRIMVQKVDSDATSIASDKRFRKILKILNKKDKKKLSKRCWKNFTMQRN